MSGPVGYDKIGRRGGVNVLGLISDLNSILHGYCSVGVVVSLASVTSDDLNSFTHTSTEDRFHVVLSAS